MTLSEALTILLAAAGAGAMNVLVGGGSLITYPTLVALGQPPVLANVSNNLGLIPASLAGARAYAPLLRGEGARLRRLLPSSLLGGLCGAALLLLLPASLFARIVPGLIALSGVLMALQPALRRWIEASAVTRLGPLRAGLFLSGVYGGYFGAAQGVLLMAVLALFLEEGLQRLNGYKNALVLAVNGTAALFFLVFSPVNWAVAALIALGSACGGWLAGRWGQHLPDSMLRPLIVITALVVAAVLWQRIA